jgi:hypothetical protein
MAFPIRLLWNLRISRMQKVAVGVAFSVGIITMICAIVRTSSLGVAANAGQIPISWLVLWAAVEGLVGTYRILVFIIHPSHYPSSPLPLSFIASLCFLAYHTPRSTRKQERPD